MILYPIERETVIRHLKDLYELGIISDPCLYKLSHKSNPKDDSPVITKEEYTYIINGK